ncbi:MAG: diphosphomevalonate decarboxylase, partial [Myxococcota bacterium]|nr:diphosphomevalonate decarboxylase [Myxococcota bacterium]
MQATAVAHPNIALIKYWGKRDVSLNLPAVSSLSLTLSDFCTKTTVHWGANSDQMYLNGAPAPK